MGTILSLSSLILLIISEEIVRCRADRFYCMGSGFIRIQLDYEPRNEHNIVPEFDIIGEESSDSSYGGHCSWQFYHSSKTAVNIILQGIDRKLLRDVRLQKRSIENSDAAFAEILPIPYDIRYPKDASCGSNTPIDFAGYLTLKTLKVISLLPGDTLTLIIQRQQPNKSSFALKLTAIDVGYCTRLTTLHRLNCHHITTGNLTLNETFEIMRQSSMQLASFENLMDVQNFIKSNKVPEDVFPIKEPLDLRIPVRIGLFNANGGQLKRFVGNNGTCAIESYFGTFLTDSNAQCVSLRVNDSGSPVIELADCSQPMPALISFSETPLTNSCLDCSRRIEKFLMDGSPMLFIQSTTAIYVITCAVGAVVFGITAYVAALIVFWKRLTAGKNLHKSHNEEWKR